jgi:DNA-binding LacI/PurR family transcriptional regulator
MSVTIIDVAKRAGVSPSTVSRVIGNHPRISSKTSKKVKDLMEEMGYHPNSTAKSLVSKKSNMLGIILPKSAEELFLNLFFSEVIRGIVTQATRGGYDILMSTGATEREEVEAITRMVKGRRVDGVILLYSRKHDPLIRFLLDEKCPFVLIGRSEQFPDILSIDNDNVQAAYDVTNHLIAQGHRRIGFVSGPSHLVVSEDRLAGYTKAMQEADLEMRPEWIVESDFIQESGYRAMSYIMSLPERPTALMAIDDVVAFGVLRGLNELGLRVPEDISLVSFNNITLSELSNPPISSVDIGIYQLGYTASQTLLHQLGGITDQQKRIIIPHKLMIRHSSMHVHRE